MSIYANDYEYGNELLIYALKRIDENVDFEDSSTNITFKFIELNEEDTPKNMPYNNKYLVSACHKYYRMITLSLMFNWMALDSDKNKSPYSNEKFKNTTTKKIKEFQKDESVQICKYWKGEKYYIEKIFK
jgi:hypothetical protein